MSREHGQSQASADALAEYMRTMNVSWEASIELSAARRRLDAALRRHREALSDEAVALAVYESTPFLEEQVS